MGENIGVGGAEDSMTLSRWIAVLMICTESPLEIGNASQVDVTKRDFSTARKYFPISL